METAAVRRARDMVRRPSFVKAVAEALQERLFPEALPSAERGLTERERRLLRDAGLLAAPMLSEINVIERTIAEYASMLSSSLTVVQAARRLGVEPARVRQRLLSRTLYGIKRDGDWCLPSFQFHPRHGEIPGIGAIVRRLPPDIHPVEFSTWFLHPAPELRLRGRAVSPLTWLRSGGSATRAADVASHLTEPF